MTKARPTVEARFIKQPCQIQQVETSPPPTPHFASMHIQSFWHVVDRQTDIHRPILSCSETGFRVEGGDWNGKELDTRLKCAVFTFLQELFRTDDFCRLLFSYFYK